MNIKVAVGALIKSRKTNRCLFLMRNERSYNGQFGLVGGKVKKDETIIEGLCREINEEIGFMPEIEKMARFTEFLSEDKEFGYLSAVIVVKDEFVPNLNKESSGYAWVSLRNLPKPMHPRVKDLFKSDIVISSIERF